MTDTLEKLECMAQPRPHCPQKWQAGRPFSGRVSTESLEATTGIFRRSHAFLITSSWARGRGGGWKMPSGSLCSPVCAA